MNVDEFVDKSLATLWNEIHRKEITFKTKIWWGGYITCLEELAPHRSEDLNSAYKRLNSLANND